MRRFLLAAIIGGLALGWAGQARACGSYLRIQVLQALADGANSASIEELRAAGPAALDELFRLRDAMTKSLAEKTKQQGPTPDDVRQIESLQQRIQRLDEIIDRLATGPSYEERVRIMRQDLGPWLYEYMPAVSIGVTHSIVGVGPKVGEWPLIPGHMGLHNWEYVTRGR